MPVKNVKVNGEKLKYYRLVVRRLTQKELADKSGVVQTNISKIENGENTNLKLATVSALAASLNIQMYDILEDPEAVLGPDSLDSKASKLSPQAKEQLERYVDFLLQQAESEDH